MRIKIRYSEESILEYQDIDGIDAQASLNQFGQSLECHLYAEYPRAKVVVELSDFDDITVNGQYDHQEINAIQSIVEKVWYGDGWLEYQES